MGRIVICILVVIWTTIPAVAGSGSHSDISARVIKIIDGDSIMVRTDTQLYEIRLWGIDCPEYKQPFAGNARRLTEKLLLGKPVRLKVKEKDRYGRLVSVVYLRDKNINEELVRLGAAWVYDRYCRENICRSWQKLEKEAKHSSLGLWQQQNAIPPWRWRRTNT